MSCQWTGFVGRPQIEAVDAFGHTLVPGLIRAWPRLARKLVRERWLAELRYHLVEQRERGPPLNSCPGRVHRFHVEDPAA